MITEDFCSYEVAKLLKEKGFDSPCMGRYSVRSKEFHLDCTKMCNNGGLFEYAAPSQAMAMKWLRKNHNILITIIPQEIKVGIDALCYGIYRITEDLYQPLYNGKVDNLVDSYEECVEAALKYALENLI